MSFYLLSKWLKSKEKPPEERPVPIPRGFGPDSLPYEPAKTLPLPPSARGKDKPKRRPGGKWIWVPDDPISEEIELYESGTVPAWVRPPRRQPHNLEY